MSDYFAQELAVREQIAQSLLAVDRRRAPGWSSDWIRRDEAAKIAMGPFTQHWLAERMGDADPETDEDIPADQLTISVENFAEAAGEDQDPCGCIPMSNVARKLTDPLPPDTELDTTKLGEGRAD